jgi:hypothetical protein
MPATAKFFACLFLYMLCLPALHAQYVVNVPAETAFAQSEYAALGTRPTPTTVPHLAPAAVVAAIANPNYLPEGSTPFTFVIAHRGSHTAPGCAENSACAIAAAYEAGADAIELDIKLTIDGAPVLGHDVTVARELNNWINSTGQPVQRSSAWTPFSGFPIVDYSYLDLTKFPLLYNFQLPSGGCCVVDLNNPPRPSMKLSQIQNGVLVDTYNQTTAETYANHQLTLYEALYLIQTYYPMVVFLDVKSPSDLKAVAPVITAARQSLGTTGALANICLKLDWKEASNPVVSGNPGGYMGLQDIKYFLVFGTQNLDAMATYNGQQPPSNPTLTASQDYATFYSLCTAANGCLGGELAHKYPNAPTQAIYNYIRLADEVQIAGFQSLPQYSWFWRMLPTQKEQATTYDKTLVRIDGSCCFALDDVRNISQYMGSVGSDTEDLRGLYSWNEANFSTITTDEPLIVLRDLTNRGERPISVAQQIGGTNTSVPSGGSAADVGPFPDGLYYIQTSTGYNLAVSGTSLALVASGQPTLQQMWYLSGKPTTNYTLTSAATGQGILLTENSGGPLLQFGPVNNNPSYLWQFGSLSGGYTIQSAVTSVEQRWMIYQGTTVSLAENASYSWNLIPVDTPSSEAAQQQRGPAGYTYCADGDLSPTQYCNFTGPTSVAYGANGSFRYLQYVSGAGLTSCQLSSFNGIDPAPGVQKACFYAPYDTAATLSVNFAYVTSDGGTLNTGGPVSFAYGAEDPATGAQLYTYATVPGGTHACGVSTFGYDPAPGIVKGCYSVSPAPPAGPASFAYCATDGGDCVFSGTAAVAYGAGSAFTYKTFANGAHCGVVSFSVDPDPNVVKSCFYMAATPLGTVTRSEVPTSLFPLCANGESGTCTGLAQGTLVAYGATYNGMPSYDFITALTSSLACNLATFGGIDPAPGVAKSCYAYAAPQSWVNRGPVGFTYCATGDVGSTCQFNGAAAVAYGDDGYFIYKAGVVNGIACNVSAFGTDPHLNYYKACFYRLY